MPELVTLHGIARGELGALRRTGGTLTITREGRRLLDDPGAMWDAATNALASAELGEDESELTMREVALMILAEGRPLRHGELTARVAEVAAVDDRRTSASADPLAPPEATHGRRASRLLARLRRRLDAFGLRVPAREGAEQLTPAGQAAALAALRAHALRPRQYVAPR